MHRKELTDAQKAVFGGIITGEPSSYPPKETTAEAASREDKRQRIAKVREHKRKIDSLKEEWDE